MCWNGTILRSTAISPYRSELGHGRGLRVNASEPALRASEAQRRLRRRKLQLQRFGDRAMGNHPFAHVQPVAQMLIFAERPSVAFAGECQDEWQRHVVKGERRRAR